MQGDDSSNDDSYSVPADATTTTENHDDDVFVAELRDFEPRSEQLELEQRSLRIQLQRARLRHAGHTTTPSTPPTTSPRQQEPSARPSPTPERSTCSGIFDGRCNNPYSRPLTATSSRAPTAQPPEQHTSHPPPTRRAEAPDLRTPQAGDRLDATGQVLRVGDTVSFHTTSYTTGGTGTVKCFTANFVIIRRDNGGQIRRAPSNITCLRVTIY